MRRLESVPRSQDVIIVLCLVLLFVLFAGNILPSFSLTVSGILFSVGIGIIPVLYTLFFRYSPVSVFALRLPSKDGILGGLFLMIGVSVLVLSSSIVADYFVREKTPAEIMLERQVFEGSFLIALVTVALLPALFEELLFRGFILTALKSVLTKTRAVWITALLFALLHADLLRFLFVFVAGLSLSFAAAKCGSLLVPVCMHFLHNSIFFVLLRLSGPDSVALSGKFIIPYLKNNPEWLLAVGSGLCIALLCVRVGFKRLSLCEKK